MPVPINTPPCTPLFSKKCHSIEDADMVKELCTDFEEGLDFAHRDDSCSLEPIIEDGVLSRSNTDYYFAEDAYIATLLLDNGTTVAIGSRIGEGTFGMVHLGLMTHPPTTDLQDGEAPPTSICAVKVVNITHPLDRRQSLDEVHVFKTLSGHDRFPEFIATRKSFLPPSCLTLNPSTEESENAAGEKFLFIVMEYVDGCSLDHWLDRYQQDNTPFPSPLLRRIAKQLLEGLVCMQSFGRVHRDIKPQNVVLDKNNNIKIVDFGLSIYESEDDAYVGSLPTVMCSGTPAFLAPEILYTYRYTSYSDVWALGATLLCMLVGPWYLQLGKLSDLDDHERNWQLMEETTRSLEGDMGDFIRKALTRKCEKRPLAADLLRHPWLANDLNLIDSD